MNHNISLYTAGMAQGCLRYVGLEVNCGFTRTAICEPTETRVTARSLTPGKEHLSFKLCSSPTQMNRTSTTVDAMDHSLIATARKSLTTSTKGGIPKNLDRSMNNSFQWSTGRLYQCTKNNHTMANCEACRDEFYHHQEHYPQGPYFKPEPVVSVDVQELHRLEKRKATRKVVAEMNASFSEGHSTLRSQLLLWNMGKSLYKRSQLQMRGSRS